MSEVLDRLTVRLEDIQARVDQLKADFGRDPAHAPRQWGAFCAQYDAFSQELRQYAGARFAPERRARRVAEELGR